MVTETTPGNQEDTYPSKIIPPFRIACIRLIMHILTHPTTKISNLENTCQENTHKLNYTTL